MSIQAVSWALAQYIPHSAKKLVLISLANHASHVDGKCYPAIGTIAKETSLSRRTVQRHLPKLVTSGFVKISTNFIDGRQTANTYWLLMPINPPRPSGGDNQSPSPSPKGRSGAHEGVHTNNPGGATVATRRNHHNLHHNNLQEDGLPKKQKRAFGALGSQPAWVTQQGRYELELVKRIGSDGYDVLGRLEDWKLKDLCLRQSKGQISDEEIEKLKLQT